MCILKVTSELLEMIRLHAKIDKHVLCGDQLLQKKKSDLVHDENIM